MEITWLGHACFRLRADDLVVVTDPFPESIGLRPDTRPATVVTISNNDPNHCDWPSIGGEPRVFSTPGEYEYSSIAVRGVMTTLPPDTPQKRRNVAYTIEMDHVHVCHLGALVTPLTTRQEEELSPVDVLLVPIGSPETLDLDRITQVMQDLDPRIVIPMQYSIPHLKLQLQSVDVFLRQMGVSDVQEQPRLNVTTANLPPEMRIVQLAPQARRA